MEVPRAVASRGPQAVATARRVLAGLDIVSLDAALLDAAGDLDVGLRSLDAIHVTSARQLGDDLECVVTYDHRMAAAARQLGTDGGRPVVAPSAGEHHDRRERDERARAVATVAGGGRGAASSTAPSARP